MSENPVLGQAIDYILTKNERLNPKGNWAIPKENKKGPDTKEIQLALAVVLVELAACDQKFDSREYEVISRSLNRLFDTNGRQIALLVERAQSLLSTFRGTSSFAALLQESLKPAQKKAVMDVIEEIIRADGIEDGFEIYLRQKFEDTLGLTERKTEDSGS